MFDVDLSRFYIDGEWRSPRLAGGESALVDPATEEVWGHLALGGKADADHAVSAAKRALPTWRNTPVAERVSLLHAIRAAYESKVEMFAQAITREMGSPIALSRLWQATLPLYHLDALVGTVERFDFERREGNMTLIREAIGGVGLITPWNWPLHQIAAKVFPALAAGCTMVLKPSELAPLSAQLFAHVLHGAGVPRGVFNIVHGTGATIGRVISSHPDIAMVDHGIYARGCPSRDRCGDDGETRRAGVGR